jgi:anti-sigma factor RsiW
MNCKQCSELLIDYLRDELPANSKATISAHLHGCINCSTELAKLQELATLLDHTEQPSARLQENFQARLAAEIATPARVPAQKAPGRFGLFQAIWPSRPFAAVCYSFALLACGLVSGQLLPPATLGFAAMDGSAAGDQLQICLVPRPINNEFL